MEEAGGGGGGESFSQQIFLLLGHSCKFGNASFWGEKYKDLWFYTLFYIFYTLFVLLVMKIVKGNLTKSSNTFWSQFSDSCVPA